MAQLRPRTLIEFFQPVSDSARLYMRPNETTTLAKILLICIKYEEIISRGEKRTWRQTLYYCTDTHAQGSLEKRLTYVTRLQVRRVITWYGLEACRALHSPFRKCVYCLCYTYCTWQHNVPLDVLLLQSHACGFD